MKRVKLYFICLLLLGINMLQAQKQNLTERLLFADSLIIDDKLEEAKVILDSIIASESILPNSLDADRLNAIFGYYYFDQDKYDSALTYFRPLLFKAWLSEDKAFMKYIGKAINDAGIVYYRIGDVDSAEMAHDRSLIIALEEDNLQLQAYNYNNLAILYKNQKEYIKAMQYYEKSLEINKAIPDLEGQGYQYLNMAMLLHDQSLFTESLENYLKSLEIFESLGDDRLKLVVYDGIGRYYTLIEDLTKATEYYDKARELAESTQNRRYIGRSLQNLGRLQRLSGNHDEAIVYFKQALAVFEPMNLQRSMYDVHNLLGHSYKDKKEYETALMHYDLALDIVKNRAPSSRIAIEISKAHVYNLIGESSKAKALALEALNRYPIEKQTKRSLSSLYGVISNAEEALGNHRSSLEYYKKMTTLEDSIFNQQKQLEIARLEFEYQLDQEKALFDLESDKQALTYQADIQKAKSSRNLLIAIIAIFIIAGVLFYRSYIIKRWAVQKLKKQANELQETNELLAQSSEKEQELFQANIDEKERRMAAIAMNQLEKESLLQKINERIEYIYKANGQTEKELKSLQKLLKANINMNNSWDSFLHQFEQIHPDFFEVLRSGFSGLTVSDLKVCAYVKIGMDNKSIAQVTNTTLNTVKSRIHRIKKKLELGPDDSIRDFLMSVDQSISASSSQLKEAQVLLSGKSLAAAKASN